MYVSSFFRDEEIYSVRFRGTAEALPPGTNNVSANQSGSATSYVSLCWGLGELYDIEYYQSRVSLNIVGNLYTKIGSGEHKEQYNSILNDKINIVHESGEGLKKFFEEANVFMMFFKPTEYRSFSMPVKLFEYLEHGRPIIANDKTVGDFIKSRYWFIAL